MFSSMIGCNPDWKWGIEIVLGGRLVICSVESKWVILRKEEEKLIQSIGLVSDSRLCESGRCAC